MATDGAENMRTTMAEPARPNIAPWWGWRPARFWLPPLALFLSVKPAVFTVEITQRATAGDAHAHRRRQVRADLDVGGDDGHADLLLTSRVHIVNSVQCVCGFSADARH